MTHDLVLLIRFSIMLGYLHPVYAMFFMMVRVVFWRLFE